MWQLFEDSFSWNYMDFFISNERNMFQASGSNETVQFHWRSCESHTDNISFIILSFLVLALLTEFDTEVFHVCGGFMQMSLSWADKLTVLQNPRGK